MVATLLMAGCSSSSNPPVAESSGDPQAAGGWEDTKIPPDIQMNWTGSVDLVEGKPTPSGNSAASPVSVPLGQKLEISGWAASDPKTGEAFDAVYVVIGHRQLRGVPASRPDVAKYYQAPQLSQSGFQISIDTSTLQKRDYALRLVGVTQNGSYYRCPYQVFVRID
jgi:hypothetical protein